MNIFLSILPVERVFSCNQTPQGVPIPCCQKKMVFYAMFSASSSSSFRRATAMVPSFQRLCERIHHRMRYLRFLNPLDFNGFPRYAFLKIPIRASVAPRLVCKRQKSSSSSLDSSSLTDRGQIAFRICSSSKSILFSGLSNPRSVA